MSNMGNWRQLFLGFSSLRAGRAGYGEQLEYAVAATRIGRFLSRELFDYDTTWAQSSLFQDESRESWLNARMIQIGDIG